MTDKRWEYLTVEVKPGFMGLRRESVQEELDKAGRNGWELVSMFSPAAGYALLLAFKRPL